MHIVFSANNNEEIKKLPIVPDFLNVSLLQNNTEVKTINAGVINLIGDLGLRTFSIKSFFPTRKYSWLRDATDIDGWSYVNFFKKWRERKVPIRVVIIHADESELINMPCTIDSFTYGIKKNKDIMYTLEIREYRFVGV